MRGIDSRFSHAEIAETDGCIACKLTSHSFCATDIGEEVLVPQDKVATSLNLATLAFDNSQSAGPGFAYTKLSFARKEQLFQIGQIERADEC